jgi:hypothetical protein
MTIYFVSSIDHLPRHEINDACYFFTTQPHTNANQSYIKFGITERQTLSKRLKQYVSENITPSNIYYKYVTLAKQRETMLIKLFNGHFEISLVKGREYFEGLHSVMLNLFCYVLSLEDTSIDINPSIKRMSHIYYQIKDATYNIQRIIEPVIVVTFPTLLCVTQKTEEENDELLIEEPTQIKVSNTLSTEQQNTNPLVCNRCGRECKDNRGLAIHQSKCGEPGREPVCPYCHTMFTCYRNLTRHYLTCKVYREIQEKQQMQSVQQKLDELEEELEAKSNMIKELHLIIQDLYAKEQEYKDQLIDQQAYKHKIIQLEVINKQQLERITGLEQTNTALNSTMIEFMKRSISSK